MLLYYYIVLRKKLNLLDFCQIVKPLLSVVLRLAICLLNITSLHLFLKSVVYLLIIGYTDFLTLVVSGNGVLVTVLILIFLNTNNLILRFMNYSYFKLIFSDLPLSVAVAFPFEVRDCNPTTYKSMWETIENNFKTTRSNLVIYYHIRECEFSRNVLKIDYRVK